MTTRRTTTRTLSKPLIPPMQLDWPPVCPRCGFTGAPSDAASPYIFCAGNPARHQRTPVGVSR